MTTIQTRVKRVGGSVLLAVPPADARQLHLREGQTLTIFVADPKASAFGAYAGLDLTSDAKSERRE